MKKLIALLVFYTSLVYAQSPATNELGLTGNISLSEELEAILPVSAYNLELEVRASGKSAADTFITLDELKKKITSVAKDSKVSVLNRNFFPEQKNNQGMGNNITLKDTIIIENVAESTVAIIIDSLAKLDNLTLKDVSPNRNSLNELRQNLSSKVTQLVIEKAKRISKEQQLTLGQIQEIAVTEEPSIDSIREQIDNSQNTGNQLKVKFVAAIRYGLK